jgi:LCP family protein required for cell wall assembly
MTATAVPGTADVGGEREPPTAADSLLTSTDRAMIMAMSSSTVTQSLTPPLALLARPPALPPLARSEDLSTFLLIGLDSTSNLRGQNTDVLIVVVVNKATRQVSILSIPRDLWVFIPTLGWSRINVAHRQGYIDDAQRTLWASGAEQPGPALLMRTIEINLGIPIDHWARIDFEGFTRVVDQLGGVEMTVPCPVNLRYVAPDPEDAEAGLEEMYLEPGVYHLDGATALRYVRTRRGTSDFDRAQRQQRFLKALWDQTRRLDIIPKIPGLWSALKDSIETDLSLGDILSLAPVALELSPQRISSRFIGSAQTTGWTNAEGWQVLLPQYEEIQRVAASLYAPLSASEGQAVGEDARVQVLNGTYRRQLAKIVADQLHWQGLDVVETGLADSPDYLETRIIVFADKPKAIEVLMKVLRVKAGNVSYQPDPTQPVDIQVILGNDYDPCR